MADKKKTKVLYAAFEAVPFTKLGGLGDVAGTLPMSISSHGCDIRVIIPYLSMISNEHRKRLQHIGDYSVFSAGKRHEFGLYYVKMRGVVFYLVKNDYYFDRPGAYGEKDDIERFAFFSRAILETISCLKDFKPDILHVNDWHTALTNLYLHEEYEEQLGEYDIKTVFTIHNLQYQGKFDYKKIKDVLALKNRKAINAVMHKGKVNLMKCGITVSDCVTTPSPSYAKEILTYEYGVGLEAVLKTKKDVTHGILNGIDYVDFNPAWDINIRVHYTKDLLERRLGNKIDLQKKFHLTENPRAPLFCVACRFYEQKGISLIIKAVPKIMEGGGQIIFLGDGDKKYKEKINEFKKKYKGAVGTHLQFDPHLPHNVYAGADVLLMPSKFEPCGIAQMMAMHYGTLPLVRSTGGLRDTVHNYQPKSLVCNGFSFKNYNYKEFSRALDTVFDVWNNDKKNWTRMQKRAMSEDFSWKESGRKYMALYDALLSGHIDQLNEQFELETVKRAEEAAMAAAAKAARHAEDRAQILKSLQEEASAAYGSVELREKKKKKKKKKEKQKKDNTKDKKKKKGKKKKK
ncbi:MAG: glycogen/starch synthase [Coriobacteriia bacterium]|nr:glycogen/starch synthase [Coriobacteriia bacterium]